jgi:hypothetical protein
MAEDPMIVAVPPVSPDASLDSPAAKERSPPVEPVPATIEIAPLLLTFELLPMADPEKMEILPLSPSITAPVDKDRLPLAASEVLKILSGVLIVREPDAPWILDPDENLAFPPFWTTEDPPLITISPPIAELEPPTILTEPPVDPAEEPAQTFMLPPKTLDDPASRSKEPPTDCNPVPPER